MRIYTWALNQTDGCDGLSLVGDVGHEHVECR